MPLIYINMAEQITSIKTIMSKLYRHPLLKDVPLETVVDYTIDFMRLIGTPGIFENKTTFITIVDYRAELPCDYYTTIQVRDSCTKLPYRYSTDSFHLSPCKDMASELTYKIQGNYIYTSIKDGELELNYSAIATDCDGFPLIPDNTPFTTALVSYIKLQRFVILFELGKLPLNVLQQAQQEYAFCAGDCESEFNRMSLDKAESFYNSFRTLIVRDTAHRNAFKNNSSKEYIKLHR